MNCVAVEQWSDRAGSHTQEGEPWVAIGSRPEANGSNPTRAPRSPGRGYNRPSSLFDLPPAGATLSRSGVFSPLFRPRPRGVAVSAAAWRTQHDSQPADALALTSVEIESKPLSRSSDRPALNPRSTTRAGRGKAPKDARKRKGDRHEDLMFPSRGLRAHHTLRGHSVPRSYPLSGGGTDLSALTPRDATSGRQARRESHPLSAEGCSSDGRRELRTGSAGIATRGLTRTRQHSALCASGGKPDLFALGRGRVPRRFSGGAA